MLCSIHSMNVDNRIVIVSSVGFNHLHMGTVHPTVMRFVVEVVDNNAYYQKKNHKYERNQNLSLQREARR